MSLQDELKKDGATFTKEAIQYATPIEYSETNASQDWLDPPPEHVSVFRNPSKWWRDNYLSWRFYVTIYAGLAVLCVLINVIALVAAALVNGINENRHILLYEGSCSRARRSSLFSHWFMAGISTYLLSASAYVMYCLTPPTREEVDKAHAKGDWLDIGAMSIRNICRVSKKRIFFFICLGFTSPGLQLLYNSVLFETFPANEYVAFVAHESFRKPGQIVVELSWNITESFRLYDIYHPLIDHLHNETVHERLQVLSNEQCIEAYGSSLQINRRHVVLIAEDDPLISADVCDHYHAPVLSERVEGPEQYGWMCDAQIANSSQCSTHLQQVRHNAANWTLPNGSKIKYCLSERTKERCKLSFNVNLFISIIFIAFFKAVVMLAVAFWVYECPIMTTGDAITSFMNRPDPYTANMCMASKKLVEQHPHNWPRWPQKYSQKRERWMTSIESMMRSLTFLMILALCGAAMVFTMTNEPVHFNEIISLGVGQINRNMFIGWSWKRASMIRSIAIANIPHAVFGVIYILFNNVFYCMIFSAEWSRYATHRKGLRVSEAPRGAQRTVYFFLMPHKIAFPIMGFSCAIHSLISQTAFLVNVEAYGFGLDFASLSAHDAQKLLHPSRQPQGDFNTIGFSPLGNVGVIVVGALMIAFMYAFGLRRFKSGMPVTSTCSAAIAAACHPAIDENQAPHLLPVSWGDVEGDAGNGVGHCAFSSKEVKPPEEGKLYY